MEDFLKLAAGLSVYNGGRYDGYTIGRARWKLNGKIHTVESRIQMEKEGYAVMEVQGFDRVQDMAGELNVTLMKTDAPFYEKIIVNKQPDTGEWFCFTPDQVESYLKRVKDTNSIHRGERAVVPGLMLADFMLEKGMILPGEKRYTMRFKSPMFIGSYFVCYVQDGKICIQSPEGETGYAQASC